MHREQSNYLDEKFLDDYNVACGDSIFRVHIIKLSS